MKNPARTLALVLSLSTSGLASANPAAQPPAALAAAPASSPATYPDADAFSARREALLAAIAANDLDQWRRGYFTGGDPGKYLPGAAMAKLLVAPDAPDALRLMNDPRSPKEHYHFAAINWARFLPLFGDKLTPETRAALAESAARYPDYLQPRGTENHRTMSLVAANVIPHHLPEAERFSGRPRAEALVTARDLLRSYVRNLYRGGQGEWDSPTYLMFTVHGLLNAYDFSPDSEVRLLAAAGLDFLVAGQALKYRDGIYTGPNQRGYYDRPYASIADQTAWLWWGGSAPPAVEDTRRWLYAIHPATSSWRPNAVLTNIARKRLTGLPVALRNTRANYWLGLGQPIDPAAYRETLHLSPSFTLGSLENGHGSQITRIHLVTTNGASGPLALTGGHPRKSDHTGKRLDTLTYRDGGGRYDQAVQFGPLLVNLSRLPDDEAIDHVFVSLPTGVTPTSHRGYAETDAPRWVLRVGDAWACVVPLGGAASVTPPDLTPKELASREKAIASGKTPAPLSSILRITGRPILGFALIAAEASAHPDAGSFLSWIDQNYVIDASALAADAAVALTLPDGSRRVVRHLPGASRAVVDPALPAPASSFSGPFVTLRDSVLTVSDGVAGYVVDFSGDSPVYRPLP